MFLRCIGNFGLIKVNFPIPSHIEEKLRNLMLNEWIIRLSIDMTTLLSSIFRACWVSFLFSFVLGMFSIGLGASYWHLSSCDVCFSRPSQVGQSLDPILDRRILQLVVLFCMNSPFPFAMLQMLLTWSFHPSSVVNVQPRCFAQLTDSRMCIVFFSADSEHIALERWTFSFHSQIPSLSRSFSNHMDLCLKILWCRLLYHL